ncbi:SDR family NAD(P)-dependent oxidoreductase [Loktanella sp. SALINAS62]|uniref:SDR family NAD(P)-dependent oxidoreductase n=1 Tax=Loktanella sp. SALINAS62 TaxID=2706124 RepID=UPI001B8AABDD|nr:SDR family NAD(P)-dependent oxidoreductase [Loktanella sp. SALINAS62]MBS1303220.1 SDR family NAD(P)-dependent oxidoreductase [Loktanella sp. SALINAS62]
MADARKFAVVTGASSGIGLELARCAIADGCDILIAAHEPEILAAAQMLRGTGATVDAVETDLGTKLGLDDLWSTIADRPIDYLMANAGQGLGDAFLNQDPRDIEQVIHVNVTGTTSLLHRAIPQMRARGSGRILITGSIAGVIPGAFQAVYNGTKAYLDILSWGLREELRDSGVTLTCLMPGPTDTEFFARADMLDTPVGQADDKDDPQKVAQAGYAAMMRGHAGVTTGFMNKVQASLAGIIPDSVLAKMHRNLAEPKEHTHDP